MGPKQGKEATPEEQKAYYYSDMYFFLKVNYLSLVIRLVVALT